MKIASPPLRPQGWAITVLEPEIFLEPWTRFPLTPSKKPISILCTSKNDIAFLEEPGEEYQILESPHYYFCADAILQLDLDVLMLRRGEDKLSMLFKVPELNLVIVGSPVGRVVLFTMVTPDVNNSQEIGLVVLPSEEQQVDGTRPCALLMGIAAAPIQGDENGRRTSEEVTRQKSVVMKSWPSDVEDLEQPELSSRRFRLLLYYEDHTILSYELSRARDGKLKTEPTNGGETSSEDSE